MKNIVKIDCVCQQHTKYVLHLPKCQFNLVVINRRGKLLLGIQGKILKLDEEYIFLVY